MDISEKEECEKIANDLVTQLLKKNPENIIPPKPYLFKNFENSKNLSAGIEMGLMMGLFAALSRIRGISDHESMGIISDLFETRLDEIAQWYENKTKST